MNLSKCIICNKLISRKEEVYLYKADNMPDPFIYYCKICHFYKITGEFKMMISLTLICSKFIKCEDKLHLIDLNNKKEITLINLSKIISISEHEVYKDLSYIQTVAGWRIAKNDFKDIIYHLDRYNIVDNLRRI